MKDILPSITRIIIILHKYYSLRDIKSESTHSTRSEEEFLLLANILLIRYFINSS